jgi:hypothetical protein
MAASTSSTMYRTLTIVSDIPSSDLGQAHSPAPVQLTLTTSSGFQVWS